MENGQIYPGSLIETSTVDEWVRQFLETGSPIRWPLCSELEATAKVSFRNRQAIKLAEQSAAEIAKRYVYLTDAEMTTMVDLVERHLLTQPLHGVGIELGSGCALLASVVAKRSAVQAVFALEVCQNFGPLIRTVEQSVIGSNSSKVIPVIGSFDQIKLADNSLDFAVENDSLHHSDDLPKTLKECARVLKPGGVLICFDRCHPNSVTDDDVTRMLDHVYSAEFLKANEYPPDIVLTRRENGEHEYRQFEWQAAAEAAGLEFTRQCEFYKSVSFKRAVKGLFPKFVQRGLKLDRKKNDLTTTRDWCVQHWRKIFPNRNRMIAPKRSSVLIMTKPKY